MKAFPSNVPVTLIFFARPDTLRKVFDQVKIAQPSQLFLIQDGPRENREDDVENIARCRKIVEDIDWECEVHRNYANRNMGISYRPTSGLDWVFSFVDRTIVLEDDVVVDPTFFPFCAEILERYKDDMRVNMIAAMNHFGVNEKCSESYFFCKSGQISSWATWKRCWELVESDLSFMDDEEVVRLLRNDLCRASSVNTIRNTAKLRQLIKSGDKLSFWSVKWNFVKHLHNGLVVVPKYNMVMNIGVGANSSFSGCSIKRIPKELQRLFFSKAYTMNFPIRHPKYMIPDREYDMKVEKLLYPQNVKGFLRIAERVWRHVIYK